LRRQIDGEAGGTKDKKNLSFEKRGESGQSGQRKNKKKQKKTKGKEKAFKADFGQKLRGKSKGGKTKRGRIQKRR